HTCSSGSTRRAPSTRTLQKVSCASSRVASRSHLNTCERRRGCVSGTDEQQHSECTHCVAQRGCNLPIPSQSSTCPSHRSLGRAGCCWRRWWRMFVVCKRRGEERSLTLSDAVVCCGDRVLVPL